MLYVIELKLKGNYFELIEAYIISHIIIGFYMFNSQYSFNSVCNWYSRFPNHIVPPWTQISFILKLRSRWVLDCPPANHRHL